MGQNAVARPGQRKGDFLAGKYLLGDCLGIGGMGEVYRATNVSLGRDVAIKILSTEFAKNEDDVLRFLREARAAALVHHPNVVDVLDVARDDDGTPFIVQELLSGEDLERHLTARGGRLSVDEALEIMIPVADAVAAAHAREVIHRDLKPANIFLARQESKITPKVLDFGASRYATVGDLSAKEKRMVIGTPNYMAPEQIITKTDVDQRADVWALGIILYELLVGETPFEAETSNAVMQLVKTRDVPPLSKVMKNAPSQIEQIVASCTARDRAKRMANAARVREAMREAREQLRANARLRVDTAPDPDEALEAVRAAARGAQQKNVPPPREEPSALLRIPSLSLPGFDEPEPPAKGGPPITGAKPAGKSRLLTLSTPDSDPPPPATHEREPPRSVSRPIEAAKPPSFGEFPLDEALLGANAPPPAPLPAPAPPNAYDAMASRGERELDHAFDSEPKLAALDLAAPPSWRPGREPQRDLATSSLPPVLDPRAAQAAAPRPTASGRPPAAGPDDRFLRQSSASMPRPSFADHARAPTSDRSVGADRDAPLPRDAKITLAAAVISPAVLAFVALRIVPLTAPIGRALRGDSTLASGVLTVVVLVVAAALSAKCVSGARDRTWFVAAGGALLFGIAMIIVTFSASETAALGEPSAVGAFASWFAPVAPLAGAFAALRRARATWLDKYDRHERIRHAAVAGVLVLLALELGPLGAVRSRPRHSPASPAAGEAPSGVAPPPSATGSAS